MKYEITHGGLRQGEVLHKRGDIVELDPVDAKRMDPRGECFKPVSKPAPEKPAPEKPAPEKPAPEKPAPPKGGGK